MFSPRNQEASGALNPLLVPADNIRRDQARHGPAQNDLAICGGEGAVALDFAGIILVYPHLLSRVMQLEARGVCMAKLTRLLSKNGTRVSNECAMLSLSSTTKMPCRNVFASK